MWLKFEDFKNVPNFGTTFAQFWHCTNGISFANNGHHPTSPVVNSLALGDAFFLHWGG